MEPSLIPALHDVLTVARTGSVRAAAAQLHKTPSAVSQQLRRVQEHFGLPLFERRGRGIRPSPAGEAALRSMVGFFDTAESLFQQLEQLAGNSATTVRIAASDYLGERLLVPVISRVVSRRIPLRFEITTTHSTEALRQVVRGQVDFGILSSPTAPERLADRVLFEQPFFWIGPRSARRLSLAERIERGPLLRLAEGSQGRRLLEEHVERAGLSPSSTVDLPSVSVLLSYARGGVGHGLVPGLALARSEPAPQAEPAAFAPLPVRVVWRPTVLHAPAIVELLDDLTTEASRASQHLRRRRR